MKFILTQRDKLVIDSIDSYGFLSSSQLQHLHFSQANKRTMLRRLRVLQREKFLTRLEVFKGAELLWCLDKFFVKKIGKDFFIKHLNKNVLHHDLVVNDVRIELEASGIGSNWRSGHLLRHKASLNKSPSERLPETIPDWLVTFLIKNKSTTCALEVELNFKGKQKMERVFYLYLEKKSLDLLWYVVPHLDQKIKLLKLGEVFSKYRGDHFFKVSLLSEIKNELRLLTSPPTPSASKSVQAIDISKDNSKKNSNITGGVKGGGP